MKRVILESPFAGDIARNERYARACMASAAPDDGDRRKADGMRANFLDPRLPDRFWSKCTPEPNSGCWLWFACTTPQGYGRIGTGGHTTEYAHRLAYMTLIGPIPPGLELDHKCTVRCCANPAHLEPVTHAENNRRSTAGEVNGAKLFPDERKDVT